MTLGKAETTPSSLRRACGHCAAIAGCDTARRAGLAGRYTVDARAGGRVERVGPGQAGLRR